MCRYEASDKQKSFLKVLLSEREHADTFSFDYCGCGHSKAISELLKQPKKPAAIKAAAEPLTDGMYMKDGIIYKAQYNRASGDGRRLYAKVLNVHGEGDDLHIAFEYAPGALKFLTAADKMSLEDAKHFGQLYGYCCVCGRTLTDETSIADGIGPVCSGRWF